MSWTLLVKYTAKADFAAAVDAAVPAGQPDGLPGINDDLATARAALKLLGGRVKRAHVAGSASGHCLQPGQDASWYDGLSVNVSGADTIRP